jgi:type VI secretion system secreted protein VgrG
MRSEQHMTFTQDQRHVGVETVLGADALLVTGFAGTEAMSRPYRFTLDLTSELPSIDAAELLGTPACVTVALPSGGERTIHGLVSRFRRVDTGVGPATYKAELVPWLWMLSLSSDCRIFQRLSIPEIVARVFDDLGYRDYRPRLVGSYEPREYCVQYRESHLDFVSRLLEEEGIFYYFEHHADRHVLVLGDSPAVIVPCPGREALVPAPVSDAGWRDDVYTTFAVEHAVRTRAVALADYNYLTPTAPLGVSIAGDRGVGEAFDYPGGYARAQEGDHYARLRLEAADVGRERATAASAAPALTPGYKVDVAGPGEEESRTWLVVEVTHSASEGALVAGAAGAAGAAGGFSYRNELALAPADLPWRPPCLTSRPRAYGTQSALVVGVAGEEIYTDAQGRVKLHFYWDRQGKRDENSSCWVRCSTAWAGHGWGQFSVPRIGQEVLVEFIEGDPDRPVVVGRVYNGEHPPPCDPGGSRGVVSGLRSKTHKGTGYNSIEMNDTAGQEKLSIHAQYDLDTVVEHSETRTVKTGTQSVTVKGDASLTIQAGNRTVGVTGGNYDVTASDAVKAHGVGAGVQITGEAKGVTVTGSGGTGVDISGTPNAEVWGDAEAYLGSPSTTVEGTTDCTVTSPSVFVTGTTDVTVDSPTIDIGKGEITIHGSKIVLQTGGGSITLDGSGVSISASKITASSSGQHVIMGAVVQIN